MKNSVIFFLLFLAAKPLYSQTGRDLDYCVKSKSLTTKDLVKTFPFSETTQIRLVSFKPEDESIPNKNGEVDQEKFIEAKTLND